MIGKFSTSAFTFEMDGKCCWRHPNGRTPATRLTRTGTRLPPRIVATLCLLCRASTHLSPVRCSCRVYLSEAIVHYRLAQPLVEARDYERPDWKELGYHESVRYKRSDMHTVYLRIQRYYQYEMHKVVFPLFIIVLMSAASFGLEPDETEARMACPVGMMLATIGVMYTIQGDLPKVPKSTKLDTYINVCIFLILLVVVQTIALKQYLEGGRFGNVTIVNRSSTGAAASTTNVVGERLEIFKDSQEWVNCEWVDFICMGVCLVLW